MTNTRGASLYSGWLMTWPIRSMKGAMPAVAGGGGEHFPGVQVERGQQGQGTVPDVFVLDPRGLAGRGRGGGAAAAAGLDGRLGVHGQDAVAGPQPLALVKPLVQVQDHGRLGGEVRVARGDPRLVLPGLDRVLGQDPQHRGHRELDRPARPW